MSSCSIGFPRGCDYWGHGKSRRLNRGFDVDRCMQGASKAKDMCDTIKQLDLSAE